MKNYRPLHFCDTNISVFLNHQNSCDIRFISQDLKVPFSGWVSYHP
jgi:hypothetical protein